MPIETYHASYEENRETWQSMRDVLGNERAVKASRERYLPRLSGWTYADQAAGGEDPYDKYLKRALFYGMTERTLVGLVGVVFRKPATVKLPTRINALRTNVDLEGTDIEQLAREVLRERLAMGRFVLLVDWPSRNQLADQGIDPESDPEFNRPTIRGYATERVRNWAFQTFRGSRRLSWVVLEEREERPVDPEDPFNVEEVPILRHLYLDPAGRYRQQKYEPERRKDGRADLRRFRRYGPEIRPTRRGEDIGFIPLFGRLDVASSAMQPIADINLSHYRSSADLEHGRHWTAVPTPWISGYTGSGEINLGSGRAIELSEGGRAGMLEFTGQGLEALEKALTQKAEYMATLGARILEAPKRASETAEAKRLDYAANASVLSHIAGEINRDITKALEAAAWWALLDSQLGGDGAEVSFALNDDYYESKLPAGELKELIAGWIQQAYPYEVLLYNLRRGELIPDHMTDEEVLDKLAVEGMLLERSFADLARAREGETTEATGGPGTAENVEARDRTGGNTRRG